MMKRMMTVLVAVGALSAGSASAASYRYNLVTDDAGAPSHSEVTGIEVNVATGMTVVNNNPHPLPVSGAWNFVFNDNGTVDFTGVLEMNKLEEYSSRTRVTVAFFGSMEGTVTYAGASHSIEGTGDWDAATRTLTYEMPSGGPDSSLGSVYSETFSECVGDGKSIMGNTVCGTWEGTTPEWEGFSLELTFAEDLGSFSGVLKAIEESGKGITANTTITSFALVGEVPVPAAAWLFGSGLVGLASLARRRSRPA